MSTTDAPRWYNTLFEYTRRNYWRYAILGIIIFAINEEFFEGRREINATLFFIIPILVLLGAVGMIRRAWLLLHQTHELKIFTLIIADMIGAAGIIIFFATLYIFADITGGGVLSYAHCGTSLAQTKTFPTVKNPGDTIYFSAITFFTVGYGDICPMGIDKAVAILNAFAGQLFTTIIIGIGLAFFTESYRQNNKKT